MNLEQIEKYIKEEWELDEQLVKLIEIIWSDDTSKRIDAYIYFKKMILKAQKEAVEQVKRQNKIPIVDVFIKLGLITLIFAILTKTFLMI